MMMTTTPQQRTAARMAAGAVSGNGRAINSYPVHVIVGGALAPRLLGTSYYHTTLSGKTIVRYPSAYGWPTQYHHSTHRVVVGDQWLAANCDSRPQDNHKS